MDIEFKHTREMKDEVLMLAEKIKLDREGKGWKGVTIENCLRIATQYFRVKRLDEDKSKTINRIVSENCNRLQGHELRLFIILINKYYDESFILEEAFNIAPSKSSCQPALSRLVANNILFRPMRAVYQINPDLFK